MRIGRVYKNIFVKVIHNKISKNCGKVDKLHILMFHVKHLKVKTLTLRKVNKSVITACFRDVRRYEIKKI